MNDVQELTTDEMQLVEKFRELSESDKKLALVFFSQAKTLTHLVTESFNDVTNCNIVIGGTMYTNGKESNSND